MTYNTPELKLLIVEDNEGDSVLIKEYLSEEVPLPRLSVATTFNEARRHLAQAQYDAILLDLSLPDGNGEDLVHNMLKCAGNTPVIVLTGYSDTEFGIRSLNLGVSDYLLKDELNSALLYRSIAYSIERKNIARKLKESNERYSIMAMATSDTIWDWDIVNDKMRYNNGISLMFGYHYDEIQNIGSWWNEKIHPDDQEHVSRTIQSVFDNKQLNMTLEYRFRCADGNYKYIFDRGFLVLDERQKPIRMIGAMQDITERKRNDLQLQDLLNITSDQNKRLQNFAYIVSHNIRSHSANIIGLVNFISESQNEEEKSKLFEMLKTSTGKLEETIENLNDIITVQNGNKLNLARVDLNEEVHKTTNAINSTILKTNAEIHIDIPRGIEIDVVPSYLESILLNLLTNAIKYRSPDRLPVIRLYTEHEGDYIILYVQDNGIGIDVQKHRDKLFGMYKTFHNNKDARGFGLFITKNQIEAMNGKIDIESTLGAGTTFKIYFYAKD